MECPHLQNCLILKSIPSHLKNKQPLICSACDTDKSPWICISCGALNCGRYINAHAKDHFEKNLEHCVCMDCYSFATFCYLCDEFAINDTSNELVDKFRDKLRVFVNPAQSETESSDASMAAPKRTSARVSERRKAKAALAGDENADSPNKRSKLIFQPLSNISAFCGYIRQLPSLEEKGRRCKTLRLRDMARTRNGAITEDNYLIVEELRKILLTLCKTSGGKASSAISPESLFSVIWRVVPRFRGYQQQDAHEFMRYLLDRLHTELLTLLPFVAGTQFLGHSKETIVTAIFGGILHSEVRCRTCGLESKKLDPFLDLSLDIPSEFVGRQPKLKDGSAAICRLSDCLASFTDIEELSESELYTCSHCKQRQPSSKKFTLKTLPNPVSAVEAFGARSESRRGRRGTSVDMKREC